MFESFGNYILKGVVTFALLVLSSYEGNDASFRSFAVSYLDGSVNVELYLDSAFENDFEEIFNTGKSIDIWFKASVSSQGTVLQEETFSHNVEYNPLIDSYLLTKGDNRQPIVCESYNSLINELSQVKWHFRRLKSVSDYDFLITSHLEKVYFEHMDKEFNLMLLWKNKSPKYKEKIRIDVATENWKGK